MQLWRVSNARLSHMTLEGDWESEGGKGHPAILDEDRVAAALPRPSGGTPSSRGCAGRRRSIGSCLCVKRQREAQRIRDQRQGDFDLGRQAQTTTRKRGADSSTYCSARAYLEKDLRWLGGRGAGKEGGERRGRATILGRLLPLPDSLRRLLPGHIIFLLLKDTTTFVRLR
jgi:hypothetical protein